MRLQWVETPYPPKKVTWTAEGSEGEGDPQGTVVLGDSRDAMALLAPNSVQCVYMDPPYNMGFDWGHYDDKYEYDQWLSMLKPIVVRAWSALKSTGSMWVSIDDRSFAILRIFLDQLLPGSFVATCVWQKRSTRENRGAIGDSHEYILVYAKNPKEFGRTRNVLPLTDNQIRTYKNPNNDPKGPWRTCPLTAQSIRGRPNQFYPITIPSGRVVLPPPGRCWLHTVDVYEQMLAEGRVWFGKDGNGAPSEIRYLSEVEGVVPWTWWPYDECGTNSEARKEGSGLFGPGFTFPTPKPEKLLHRIIAIASNPGDLVVDPFAGSGTTAAVAMKMGRRFFTSELSEETFRDYVVERLRKVGGPFTYGKVQTTDIVGTNDFDHVFA